MKKLLVILLGLFSTLGSLEGQTVTPTFHGGTGLVLGAADTMQLLLTNGRNPMHLLPWLNDTTKFLGSDLQWHTISTGGSLTIGELINNSSTGSVLFVGSFADLQQDQANFYYDSSCKCLAIATNGNGAINALTIGPNFEFQITSGGDIASLKGVLYSWPSSQGAANTFLKNDGSGNLGWATLSSGSSFPPFPHDPTLFLRGDSTWAKALINWYDSVNTSAPNTTIPAVALVVKNTATNVDAVIQPKGLGGLALNIADNTATGGDKRGTNAIDLQVSRNSSTQVASGFHSFIGGGGLNTANGTGYSSVLNGFNNISSGSYSLIAGGNGNTASNDQASVVNGLNNTASGALSFIGGGGGNTASRSHAAIMAGNSNFVNGFASWIGSGLNDSIATAANFSSIVGGYGLTLNGNSDFGFLGNHGIATLSTYTMQIDTANVAVLANVDLWLANNDTSAKGLKFYAPNQTKGFFPNSTKYVGFRAGNITTTQNYILPLSDGSSGQFLSTNGSGTLSWQSAGGAGTVTSVDGSGGTTGLTLSGGPITTSGALTLGGTLVVANGGTGAATLASNGVLYGNGTGAIQALAVNSTATNKFLTQSSSGAPAWNTIVAGDVPNLDASILTAGTLSAARMPALTGDVTTTVGTVATTIANDAVTTAKLLNSNVTLAKIANASASSKLLGSGASGSGAAYTELTLGTGLSMSGTTLNGTAALSGLTANGFVYPTSSSAITSTAAATNGQILIGSTGSTPVAATITGTSGNVTVTNGAGTITLTAPIKLYQSYTQDLISTTNEITVDSAYIGANEFADGDRMEWSYADSTEVASTANITIKFYYNGNSATINSAVSQTGSATIGRTLRTLHIRRIGSDVWFTFVQPGTQNLTADIFAASSSLGQGGGVLTSQVFNAGVPIKITITMSVSNSGNFYKFRAVQLYKYSGTP